MKTAAFLLLAPLALAACDQQKAGEPVIRTEIGKGSEEMAQARRTLSPCKTEIFEDVLLTHCVADPTKHRIRTVLVGADGKPYRSLRALGEALGNAALKVEFAVNGGMFDGEGKPIGYYVEHGERLQELNRADGPGNFHLKPNGVFFGTGDKWEVSTAEDFYANVGDRPEFGTQSGPMLVIGGELHPQITEKGPSKAIRNGVGVDAQGRAHFVISEAPLSFGQLARYFRDEITISNALFLDGNVSSLWIPVAERLDTGEPIGPIIVVETKD